MWAFSVLGIKATSDQKEVKRAYAKLLKKHRPDDDPQGFQRLNEAYQAALSWGDGRNAYVVPRVDDEPLPSKPKKRKQAEKPIKGTAFDGEYTSAQGFDVLAAPKDAQAQEEKQDKQQEEFSREISAKSYEPIETSEIDEFIFGAVLDKA